MIKTKRRNLLKLAGNLFGGWLIFSRFPKKNKQKLTSTEKVRSQKYDSAYHRRLEKEFPDWQERIAYQEKQKRLYDSAIRKEREASKLSNVYKTPKLDVKNISEGFILYEKLVI